MAYNEKVDQLLGDIRQHNPDKYEIVERVRKIAQEIVPDARERVMYGGIVVFAPNSVCGYFARQTHVTLELEGGPNLDDSFGVLEGRGKHRRHIKLRTLQDIDAKRIDHYIKEAYAFSASA